MRQIDVRHLCHLYYAYMEFHHLRALVTIAETGSFMAAAKHLGVSQSSLSHAVSNLEEELGLRLLERSRQGTQPTETGRHLLIHARQILVSMESMRAEAANLTGLSSGRVRIGSVPSTAIALMPKLIAQIAREHPKIEFMLLEEPSQGMHQLVEWLNVNIIDVALLELPVAGVHVVPLMRDELCAIVSAASILAKQHEISIRDLAREPFIMSRYNSERLIRKAYAKHKCSPAVRFDVQDIGTLVSMVREGLGVSIVPKVAFPVPIDGVTLRSLQPQIIRRLGFVMKSADSVPPAVRAFVQKALTLADSGAELLRESSAGVPRNELSHGRPCRSPQSRH